MLDSSDLAPIQWAGASSKRWVFNTSGRERRVDDQRLPWPTVCGIRVRDGSGLFPSSARSSTKRVVETNERKVLMQAANMLRSHNEPEGKWR